MSAHSVTIVLRQNVEKAIFPSDKPRQEINTSSFAYDRNSGLRRAGAARMELRVSRVRSLKDISAVQPHRELYLCRVTYMISVEVNFAMLVVEAEQTDSGERWKGEFTSQCNFVHQDSLSKTFF